MSRPKTNSLFELGGQWIAKDPASPYLYRFWHDEGTGRTRRKSLGSADIEEAKNKLAQIIIAGEPTRNDTYLVVVLKNYCEQHGDMTTTAKQARHSSRLFLECWGDHIRVGAITEDKQREFAQWSLKKGHALSYIARNMVVLSAALRRAKQPLEIVTSVTKMQTEWRLNGKAPRKPYIPTDVEIARLWATQMPKDLRRWILVSMATGCRPTAALDLTPSARVRDAGLLCLNPEGRMQNKKVRPTVRCPEILATALDTWERRGIDRLGNRYIGYSGHYSIRQALHRACTRESVNIPKLTPYSFRHKVATVLRLAKVPSEQISYQLGHRGANSRITAGYGEYDPDYLAEACTAINQWINKVQTLACEQSLSQDNPNQKVGSPSKAA